jgi:hypothetical protein
MKVTFEDGREKEFIGQSVKPVEIGKYYKFTYTLHDQIIEIEELK